MFTFATKLKIVIKKFLINKRLVSVYGYDNGLLFWNESFVF